MTGAAARPDPAGDPGRPAPSRLPPAAESEPPAAHPEPPAAYPEPTAPSRFPPAAQPESLTPSRLPPGVSRIRVLRDDNDGLRASGDFSDVPAALAEVERHMRRPSVYSIMIIFDA